VLRNQSLPEWAVRLFVAALLLPPLLCALDGLARVRRRREPVLPWLGWVAATAAPFLLAGLLLVVLRLLGLLTAPAAPVVPGAIGVSMPALIAVLAVLAFGFLALVPLVARRLGLGGPGVSGAAIACALVVLGLTVLVWLFNPYTALFLVLAAHLWLLANAPELRVGRGVRLALVLVGLLPLALGAAAYAVALDAGPVELAWMGTLLVAGGHVGLLGLVLWSLIAGCALATLLVALRSRHAPSDGPRADQVRSRGPISYAGPGSLGGTDSALRR
jgi:hypothetical protein